MQRILLTIRAVFFCGAVLAPRFALPLAAQEAPAPTAAPAASPEVKAMIEKAKQIAGTTWPGVERFLCEEPRGARATDPPIAPVKIFDNVYLLGRSGSEVYAVTTSAGILLIDAGGATDVESLLIPGLQKVGLDPANIKEVVVSHGHADHFGGAAYLQNHFGARVLISSEDWTLMEHPPAPREGEQKRAQAPVLPKHDLTIQEGEPIVLGDFSMAPVFIPGHTPGAMGFIFPVKDQGKPHMAALYGGAVLLVQVMSGTADQYRQSIDHFMQETKKQKVDVELKDYPLLDGQEEKLAALRVRGTGEPNPLVVGYDNYQKFLEVTRACFDAQIAIHKH